MLVVTLDVGTSSARALAFDDGGRAVPGAEGHAAYEPRTTPDGGVELDAEALFDSVARALDECLAGCGSRAAEITAVGASVFWHSLLALDRTGRPLTPVMTWADTRSATAARALRRELDERAVHRRTGAPIHSAFFPAKLRWLREMRPEVFAQAARWCGFAELLHERLTGALRCSLSMASGTGLLDQGRPVHRFESRPAVADVDDCCRFVHVASGISSRRCRRYAARAPATFRILRSIDFRRSAAAQHLARIHDAARVERIFDPVHQIERDRRFVAFQFTHLELTDTVLGAEAATIARDQIVHGPVHQ